MSTAGAPAGSPAAASPAASAVPSDAPPGWPWRQAALFLAGAAQLITISVLVSADPIAVTWSSLPARLAAVSLADQVGRAGLQRRCGCPERALTSWPDGASGCRRA
jgi:hypothetical protein